MKNLSLVLIVILSSCATDPSHDTDSNAKAVESGGLDLGAFSVSLAVKDLAASRAFYEKLGFASVMGEPTQNWLILRNGATTIGLFQGFFPKNVLTFNPGWSQQAAPLDTFTDVRELQSTLMGRGVEIHTKVNAASRSGPGSFVIVDPDGNGVLFDQPVPSPGGGK